MYGYDDSFNDFRARLIGKGCIPHLPQAPPDIVPPVPFKATNRAVRADGSGYAISGFALLTMDGPKMTVDYINEDGTVFATENWVANGAVNP